MRRAPLSGEPCKCSRCGDEKPYTEENFYFPKGKVKRRSKWCRECYKAYYRDYQRRVREDVKVREKQAAWRRQWRKKNPEKWDAQKGRQRDEYAAIRETVLRKYGGDPPKCACCGEEQVIFLTLDHTAGNGAEERKEIPTWQLYRRLAKGRKRKGYRVLCHNCNHAAYHGGCPHPAGVRNR